MKKRHLLESIAIGGALWMAAVCPAAEKPNVILLLTDDQVYNSLGYTGNRQVRTPHLDRLASQGVIFNRAYDTTSICMASRACVMTGMYEYKTGCNFSHGPLLRDKWRKSYPMLLREAGYFTGFVGKFGFSVKDPGGSSSYHTNEDLPMDDFDAWYGWPGQGSYKTVDNEFVAQYAEKYPHVTRAVGAASSYFIKTARQQDKPFCLSVSFKAPHSPKSPDPEFDDVYAQTHWEMPPNYDQKGAAHIPEQAKCGRQYRQIDDFEPDDYQTTMRKYHQLIHAVDVAVGMIMETLQEQGVAENTVVLYLTDNGYSCGAHGMGGKVLPYEEPSRSPMVIYDPRHAVSGQGRRCGAVVGNIDMAPTILALAGLPVPGQMDGKSLLPLLDDPSGRVRDSMLLINVWGNAPIHSLAVVTEEHKYIHWPYAQGMEPQEELYRISSDCYEMKNLVADPESREVLVKMQQHHDMALKAWKAECVSHGGYPQYVALFDRQLPWHAKLAALEKRTRRKFEEWKAAEPVEKKRKSK